MGARDLCVPERAGAVARAGRVTGSDELRQRPSSRRRGDRFARPKRQPLIEDCDVRPRNCVPMHGRVRACSRSTAQRTATTAVGLELGSDDGLDGTIGFDGEQSSAPLIGVIAMPRKGAPAPTDADDRFDDSRHPRRTHASNGSRSSGARVSSERHGRRVGRSLLAHCATGVHSPPPTYRYASCLCRA